MTAAAGATALLLPGGTPRLVGLCGAILLAADLPARIFTLPLSIFTVLLAVPVLGVLLCRRKEERDA